MQSPSLEHSQNFTPLFPFKSWSWILNVNESDFWLVGVKKWFTLFYCCNKLKGAQITIVENMNKMLEPGQRSDKQNSSLVTKRVHKYRKDSFFDFDLVSIPVVVKGSYRWTACNALLARVGPRLCRIVVLVPSQGEIKTVFVGSWHCPNFGGDLERSK